MYKDVLRSIADIDLFPVFAFVIFITFFVGLLVYVFRLDKKDVSRMAAMPLEDQVPAEPIVPFSFNGQVKNS